MSDSDSNSRRAALNYRLHIQPGVPVPREVVSLALLRLRRKFPGVLPEDVVDIAFRPGWIVPLYMACESIGAALTDAQKEICLPLDMVDSGWRLRFRIVTMTIAGLAMPETLTGISRQYEARILNTCSSCGAPGRLYPERLGFPRDVLCRKCAAPRRLLANLSVLDRPVWIGTGDAARLDRQQLPPPWRQQLVLWSLRSGLIKKPITPAIYSHWLTALEPAVQAILVRAKQHYAQETHEAMDDIVNWFSNYRYG